MLPLSFRQHFCCHEESTDYPHHSLEIMSIFSRSKHFFFLLQPNSFSITCRNLHLHSLGENLFEHVGNGYQNQNVSMGCQRCIWGKRGEQRVERQPLHEQLAAMTGRHPSGLDGRRQVLQERARSSCADNTRSKILPQYLTRRCLWNMKAGCLFAGCLSVFVICISGCSGTYYSMHESSVRIADQACEVPLQR